MLTLKSLPQSILLFALVAAGGCNENRGKPKPNALEEGANPNGSAAKDKPPPRQKDPVEEFRAFARTIVASSQEVVKNRRFTVRGQFVEATARFEIDSDYSIDVKKSDSLISPYVGEIKLRRRVVYDQLLGVKDRAEPWHTVVIECGYQNGDWKVNTDLSERLQRME